MPDFEALDARIASALNKIIHNAQFNRRISLEEQKAQKQDRFLRGRQVAYLIYEYFRVTGANDSVENYADLFTIAVRNDDIQEFDSKWDGILLSMTKISPDDILEGLYKLRTRESDKLKTVMELYDLETHQKKAACDVNASDPTGVPSILNPSGFQTSSPKSSMLGGRAEDLFHILVFPHGTGCPRGPISHQEGQTTPGTAWVRHHVDIVKKREKQLSGVTSSESVWFAHHTQNCTLTTHMLMRDVTWMISFSGETRLRASSLQTTELLCRHAKRARGLLDSELVQRCAQGLAALSPSACPREGLFPRSQPPEG